MRLKYQPKVTFHTQNIETSSGMMDELTDRTAIISTVEKLRDGETIELEIAMILGTNPIQTSVTGKITSKDPKSTVAMSRYLVQFAENTPASVKNMLRTADRYSPDSDSQASAKYEKQEPRVPKYQAKLKDKQSVGFSAPVNRPSKNAALASKGFLIALVCVAVVGTVFFGYRMYLSMGLHAVFPEDFPITKVTIQEGSLNAVIRPEWAENTASELKRQQLQNLAIRLHEKRLKSASIRVPSGKEVATVMINPGLPPERARIAIMD